MATRIIGNAVGRLACGRGGVIAAASAGRAELP